MPVPPPGSVVRRGRDWQPDASDCDPSMIGVVLESIDAPHASQCVRVLWLSTGTIADYGRDTTTDPHDFTLVAPVQFVVRLVPGSILTVRRHSPLCRASGVVKTGAGATRRMAAPAMAVL